MKEIWNNITNLFLSPRFISFYWQAGIFTAVGLIALISGSLESIGLSDFWIVIVSGILTQATKALNNLKQGKDLGFAKK